MSNNPFAPSTSNPGNGTIHLALLPPNTPRLKTVSYRYPLKLISPAPTRASSLGPPHVIHTVYLLTYGGGLVAGDTIDLSVRLEPSTRLILLTQGSTKLFKSPSRAVRSSQRTTVHLDPGAALCYLPDPVQPFEHSCFEQRQAYNITVATTDGDDGLERTAASLCVLDWVSSGRPANGEDWSFYRYASGNELFLCHAGATPRLLLRDNVRLDDEELGLGGVARRMDGLKVFGTLILYGDVFAALGRFFMDEFRALPRIGGRNWDVGSQEGDDQIDSTPSGRAERQRQETAEGLLWSAASVRGCVVIKFAAKELEGGRQWLRSMLIAEGSVVREFGERSLLCLR